jgi:hypothetical protein
VSEAVFPALGVLNFDGLQVFRLNPDGTANLLMSKSPVFTQLVDEPL